MRNAIWQVPRSWRLRQSPATSAAPREPASRKLTRHFEQFATASTSAEQVAIFFPGFHPAFRGRLVCLPQDNLNTDGIYGKDYTYREDMTPEMMARVVMENYDPQFAARTDAGDVVVSGFNFGTGSSREQAVTALKCKGIPLVIAGSFSQTYLRNAFNNGFLCIASPELVQRLRAQFVAIGKEKTFIPGDLIEVDFAASTIHYCGRDVRFLRDGRCAAIVGDCRRSGKPGQTKAGRRRTV